MTAIIIILLSIFGMALIFVRPVILFCRRHAIDPNIWLMRLIAGWVLVWVGGSMVMTNIMGYDGSFRTIGILLLLSIIWYLLVWYRLRNTNKGELFDDKINEIGKHTKTLEP
ncbi:MAG: hypothetical protein R3B47_21060 [Bacteroidia bacterium]